MSGKCLIGHGVRSKVVIFKVLVGMTCDISSERIFCAELNGGGPESVRHQEVNVNTVFWTLRCYKSP